MKKCRLRVVSIVRASIVKRRRKGNLDSRQPAVGRGREDMNVNADVNAIDKWRYYK